MVESKGIFNGKWLSGSTSTNACGDEVLGGVNGVNGVNSLNNPNPNNGSNSGSNGGSESMPSSYNKSFQKVNQFQGGAISPSASEKKYSLSKAIAKSCAGVWGVLQIVLILSNAIKRLVPIALQPFVQKDLGPGEWTMYVTWCLFMAYNEGYKAFQLKFSPLVVDRAFGIYENPSVLKYILAGPYSMGLFGAEKKRMIISWSITAGVFSLVKLVKMLPYPYRSIVDSGVVVGLSYGTTSILFLTIRALFTTLRGKGLKEKEV